MKYLFGYRWTLAQTESSELLQKKQEDLHNTYYNNMVMYINNKNSDTDSTVSGLKVSLSLPLIRSPTEQFAAGQEKSGQEQGESLLHTGQGAHKGEQGGRDGGLRRLQAVRLLL